MRTGWPAQQLDWMGIGGQAAWQLMPACAEEGSAPLAQVGEDASAGAGADGEGEFEEDLLDVGLDGTLGDDQAVGDGRLGSPSATSASTSRSGPVSWSRGLLDQPGFDAQIARKGSSAPIQAGTCGAVERTYLWMNGYGKLGGCSERDAIIVDLYLYLAPRWFTIRQLIQRVRSRYRWDTRAAAPSG